MEAGVHREPGMGRQLRIDRMAWDGCFGRRAEMSSMRKGSWLRAECRAHGSRNGETGGGWPSSSTTMSKSADLREQRCDELLKRGMYCYECAGRAWEAVASDIASNLRHSDTLARKKTYAQFERRTMNLTNKCAAMRSSSRAKKPRRCVGSFRTIYGNGYTWAGREHLWCLVSGLNIILAASE